MAGMTEYQRLVQNLRRLGLSKVEEYLPGYIDSGQAARKPLAEALLELTDQEIRFRDERAADMNFKLSNFPARKTLASFDFAFQPGLDRAKVADLGTLRFVEEGSNVVLIGPPGTGKTHIAIALGIEASSNHVATYFIHFRELVRRMRKAIAEGREEYLLKNINKYKLLIVDEIGYFAVDPAVGNLFFQLVAARYEARSLVVTSNKALSKWDEIFPDPVMANAIIDRLVHHCAVLRLNGRSYRVKGKLDEERAAAAEPLGAKGEAADR